MSSTPKNRQDKRLQTRPLFAALRAMATVGLRGLRKPGNCRRLELVETLPLGAKRQVFLISCDGRQFLIGAGADAVTAITPIVPALACGPADLANLQTAALSEGRQGSLPQ